MIRLSFVVIVLMACVACASQNPGVYSRPGPYIGVSVIGAGSNFKNMEDQDLDDGVGTAGIGGRFGYKLWDRAAIEVAGEGGLRFKGDAVDIDVWNVMLQAKLFMGEERWQPYLLVGGGWGEASMDTPRLSVDGFVARFGGGLQYYITEHWPVFIEIHYTGGFGDMEDFNYFAGHAGVMYRF